MLKKLNRNVLITIVALITILLDQVSKIIARSSLTMYEEHSFLGNVFVIQHTENTGAFLSLGSQLPENIRFLIFSVIVGLGLLYVLWSLIKEKGMEFHETFAWSMIIGGGIGNLIDRIGRGSVTDFLNLGLGSLRTGIFNVADMAVTAGAIILFWSAISKKMKSRKTA